MERHTLLSWHNSFISFSLMLYTCSSIFMTPYIVFFRNYLNLIHPLLSWSSTLSFPTHILHICIFFFDLSLSICSKWLNHLSIPLWFSQPRTLLYQILTKYIHLLLCQAVFPQLFLSDLISNAFNLIHPFAGLKIHSRT